MKNSNNKYDLIVIGGGLSGVASAVCAAKEGLKVLIIEQSGYLGGAACNNLVNPFMVYWRTLCGQKDILNRGVFSCVCEKLKARNAITDDGLVFHEEYLKIVLDELVKENNIIISFHTVLIDANSKDGEINDITVYNKNGKTVLESDYYIDATGDGDLANLAGFKSELGDENGNCQPMTLCFNVGNVKFGDLTYFQVREKVNGLYKQFQAEGKIKNPRENVLIFKSFQPNTLHFNSTRIINRNPVDSDDLSKAETEGREQVFELFDFLKNNFEMFKDSYITNIAPSIGIRESRRIIGEYVLNEEDLLACRKFDDSVARGNYPIDIHNPTGKGTVLKDIKEGEYYTIPARCLIPKNSKNLCVVGRCISSTHAAQASFRIMPIVCAIGEGGGAIVAQVKKSNLLVSDFNIKEVHDILDKNGALY